MIILNYSHPILETQREQIVALTGQAIERVIDINSQIDQQQPLGPQIVALADAAGLSAAQWQSEAILVNLPALNFSAAALLAELHGRMGYFPPVLRLRPVAGALPPRYEVAEILNLQVLRDEARTRRAQ
ncbi:CRISPR-associated protein Csx15 [uncultured Chloroflexus sp.]|uniref:CRISPR-associated protein Csx15 n=1 Tax=uncultured Chloroflexus sp. TaxID=214040 RepID=UPI00261DE481|nr:CRISPR-associated protein Csx15 [uncultured Chloroflexus sp.]